MSLVIPQGNNRKSKKKLGMRKNAQGSEFRAEVRKDLYYIDDDIGPYAGSVVSEDLFRKLCYLYAKGGIKGTFYVDDSLFVTDDGDEYNLEVENIKKL